MNRPSYLSKYLFDWELFDVMFEGCSALDTTSFLGAIGEGEKVDRFLESYGFDQTDPVMKAELFGNYQEAIQFIRTYFLKDGNPDGIDETIPSSLCVLTDTRELFLVAGGKRRGNTYEERIWAGIILKVMHTIIHVDKDLRHNYFSVIQQQIFDRFYKYLLRDKEDLFFYHEKKNIRIPLYDFQTKSKKSRDSIILKLLHKPENVAEQLFDRVGIRFVTYKRSDIIALAQFLEENNVIVPHNIKPSRSFNSLIDFKVLKKKHHKLIREAMRKGWTEEEFGQKFDKIVDESGKVDVSQKRNAFSSKKYQALQFTCRQLIQFKDPFAERFLEIRRKAKEVQKEGEDGELLKAILGLEIPHIGRDIRFFYPYEVQITDCQGHVENTKGEASHESYKQSQLQGVIQRLFKTLNHYRRQ